MSLSDKGIVTFRGGLGGKKLFRFEDKDVKEFIRDLKEEITPKSPTKEFQEECIWCSKDLNKIIDKKAGEGLI